MTNDLSQICQTCGCEKGAHSIRYNDCPAATFNGTRFAPPPPTPEQLRLENNERVKAEWRKERFEVEASSNGNSGWYDVDEPYWEAAVWFRRKPAPTVEPWSFETAPCVGKVRRKSDRREAAMFALPQNARLFDSGWFHVSYADLSRDYEQLSGEPCGTIGGAR